MSAVWTLYIVEDIDLQRVCVLTFNESTLFVGSSPVLGLGITTSVTSGQEEEQG